MTELVRVRLPWGAEVTINKDVLREDDEVEILKDAETLDHRGRPLRPTRKGRLIKPRTTVEEAASRSSARKTTGSTAGSEGGTNK